MRRLLRAAGQAALVCWAASLVAFALVAFTGDAAVSIGGMEASPADLDRIRQFYGLDRSLPAQYLHWAAGLLHGDLGTSFFSHQPVLGLVLAHLPVTAALAAASMSLSLAVSLPLGAAAATHEGRWPDRLCLALSTAAQSMPAYWSALLLILLFGVQLQWLPISGTESWRSFVLPAIALAWFTMPVLARLTRAGLLDVLRTDYVRAARAKGLPARTVLLRHALRPAILPVVSVASVQLGVLLGGSVVVESVFALDGIGLLAWNAVQQSDYPVLQGIVVAVAVIFVLVNLLAEALNGLLDPRLRTA